MRAADLVMRRAKRQLRGSYCYFEAGMDAELSLRLVKEAAIRMAITNDEINPHFQPLIRLADNVLVGFELLARWHHPTEGLRMPDTFIPLAEEAGLLPRHDTQSASSGVPRSKPLAAAPLHRR